MVLLRPAAKPALFTGGGSGGSGGSSVSAAPCPALSTPAYPATAPPQPPTPRPSSSRTPSSLEPAQQALECHDSKVLAEARQLPALQPQLALRARAAQEGFRSAGSWQRVGVRYVCARAAHRARPRAASSFPWAARALPPGSSLGWDSLPSLPLPPAAGTAATTAPKGAHAPGMRLPRLPIVNRAAHQPPTVDALTGHSNIIVLIAHQRLGALLRLLGAIAVQWGPHPADYANRYAGGLDWIYRPASSNLQRALPGGSCLLRPSTSEQGAAGEERAWPAIPHPNPVTDDLEIAIQPLAQGYSDSRYWGPSGMWPG